MQNKSPACKPILTTYALNLFHQTTDKGNFSETVWQPNAGLGNMTAQLTLASKLDFGAVTDLKRAVLDQVGNDLEIDASGVEHMGTLCLQVLLAAANDWAAAGYKFQFKNSSDICLSQLSLHGYTPDTITRKAST